MPYGYDVCVCVCLNEYIYNGIEHRRLFTNIASVSYRFQYDIAFSKM